MKKTEMTEMTKVNITVGDVVNLHMVEPWQSIGWVEGMVKEISFTEDREGGVVTIFSELGIEYPLTIGDHAEVRKGPARQRVRVISLEASPGFEGATVKFLAPAPTADAVTELEFLTEELRQIRKKMEKRNPDSPLSVPEDD